MQSFKKYIVAILLIAGCSKSDFEKNYTNPSSIATTTVSRQFAGLLYSNIAEVVPNYGPYFVIYRATLNQYTQATGWINLNNQYTPGEAAVQSKWDDYYNMLAQYREFQAVYADLNQGDRDSNRIYMIAATTFFYDQTERMVDLFGDIPWSKAGMLHNDGGNYTAAAPAYDDAATIYTTMLDTLKGFAGELNTTKVNAGILVGFKAQDIINNGNIPLWAKYCNSLRLRMLTRVSAAPALAARAAQEIKTIVIDAPASNRVATANTDNIQVDVVNPSTPVSASSVQSALEAAPPFSPNLAGKAMIDFLNQTADPRERVLFEPGAGASGAYIGLDPTLNPTDQGVQVAAAQIAIWNRSTISRNKFLPGILITAAEVQFLMAEAFLNNSDDANAQAAYENGIKASIDNMYQIRALSTDNTSGAVTPYTPLEVSNYLANAAVSWAAATTADQKMQLIATQKWLHFGLLEPYENWAELRRLDKPTLSFFVDNSSTQTQPPYRWYYANSEKVYNAANYAKVSAEDKLTVKLFWDVQ